MIEVILTSNLQKYFPKAKLQVAATDILQLLKKMDEISPRFSSYILEDDLSVRKHVNIFLDGALIAKNNTRQKLKDGQTVHIMQALSGG